MMDITTFWKLVESARADDPETTTEQLRELLYDLTPEQLTDFYRHFEKCYQASNRGEIWAAASILNGGGATDDVFEYFRYWLISQGRAVYDLALQNPDTLAEVYIPLEDGIPSAQNEDYGYVAQDVYAELTGVEILDAKPFEETSEGTDWDWQEYGGNDSKEIFPKLWKKYGEYFQSAESIERSVREKSVPEYLVNGLGVLRVGEKIHHKSYGDGIIREIIAWDAVDNATVYIQFLNEEQPQRMSIIPFTAPLYRLQQ